MKRFTNYFHRGGDTTQVSVWVPKTVPVAGGTHMLPPSSSPLESSAVLSQEEFDARRQYFLDSAEFTIDVPRFPEHDGGKDVSFEIWRNPSTDRLEVIGAVRVESPGFPLNL